MDITATITESTPIEVSVQTGLAGTSGTSGSSSTSGSSGSSGTSPGQHNDLSSIQGGTTGQYYHLSLSDFEKATAGTSNFSGTASYATSAGQAGTAVKATSSGQAGSAGSSTTAANAGTASYATTAAIAGTAPYAGTASYATSAGQAGTATKATSAGNAGTSYVSTREATTSQTGVVELATVAETVAGTSTSLTPTCDGVAAAAAVVKNPLAPAQGVNLTAASAAPISIADNDNIDFGTGNFTLVWSGSIPDWTPSAAVTIFQKIVAGVTGFRVQISQTGYPYLVLYRADAGTTYTATAPISATDGVFVALGIVVTRETASTAGSVVFYYNGHPLGTGVAITAGSPVSISSSGTAYVCGESNIRYNSNTSAFFLFNRALTAAEVLDLFRNGINFADKWGSQTAFYTSDFSAGVDGWAAGGGTGAGNVDGIGGQNDNYKFYADGTTGTHLSYKSVTAGKRYRLMYAVYIPSANTNLKGLRLSASSSGYVNITTTDSWVSGFVDSTEANISSAIYAFGLNGAGSTSWTGANSSSDDIFYMRTMVIYYSGATLALEPEGIQPNPGQWLDSSTNKLHAMQPAAGSSLTRFKKDFEYRWTNTWTASSAAQYVGGLNQAVLSADHFITSITTQATVTTDVENLELGDGSDVDRFVAAFTPSATRTSQTIANQNDGTNLKLVYTPAAEATMTVETIIRGFIWEP